MKTKHIVAGLIVVVAVGAGIFAFFKWHHHDADAADDEEKSEPPQVSVQVGALKRMTLNHYITAYGTIEPAPATASEPAASASAVATVSGIVTRVNVVEGQHVNLGDVLIELNSSSMTLKYADEEAARQKKLYAQGNTSLRDLQSAEAQLALLRLRAPLSGTVMRVNVTPGAAVDLTTVVAEIVDLTRLTVRTQVPESEAAELKVGEEAQLPGDPPVKGSLFFVSPAIDTNDGTVLARARLQLPPESALRPGQFIQLRIVTGIHTDCLAAPDESVVTDSKGHSVIALVQGDQAAQTPVKTGYRENGWVEIQDAGLKQGDSIVTVGAYGLPDKTKIKVVKPSGADTSQTNSPSEK